MDETKERSFLLVAAVVLPSDLIRARRTVRSLVLPHQRRIHFHKERDDRRRQIVTAITTIGVQATVFDAVGHRTTKAARDACLAGLVEYAAKTSAARLVIERDDSTLKADQRLLFDEVRRAGIAGQLRYDHLKAHEECLLAIPDALAWCWARGGHWRTAVRAVVTESHRV
ncbi:hypothetical protein TPA0907_50310 [Micromonospora humidisoli]|uniref:Resolvase, N terminal domain n=1 Tax=Micromonospora humidisoli TaxID=2807622 RepID=A0ABS2JAG3_9ACTN|nr:MULTISPECIES: hypothetical protein [Micromonospora]MBM7083488.1 hypothetical protein [Micromonospora humidisoli]GHJ10664.1 hypothetical protein TPA0907_50310 [Micromonospora sp. AKA109]